MRGGREGCGGEEWDGGGSVLSLRLLCCIRLLFISALMDLVVEWHPDSCSCSDNLTLKLTHESLHLLLQHAKRCR